MAHPTCHRLHRCPLPSGHSGLCVPTPIVETPDPRIDNSLFHQHHYDPTVPGDHNKDVPRDVQSELIKCSQAMHVSLDYLCAIYRKGRADGAAGTRRALDEALNTGDGSYRP